MPPKADYSDSHADLALGPRAGPGRL